MAWCKQTINKISTLVACITGTYPRKIRGMQPLCPGSSKTEMRRGESGFGAAIILKRIGLVLYALGATLVLAVEVDPLLALGLVLTITGTTLLATKSTRL